MNRFIGLLQIITGFMIAINSVLIACLISVLVLPFAIGLAICRQVKDVLLGIHQETNNILNRCGDIISSGLTKLK